MLKDGDTDFADADSCPDRAARTSSAFSLHKASGNGRAPARRGFSRRVAGRCRATRRHIHLPPFSGTASGRHARRQFRRRLRSGQPWKAASSFSMGRTMDCSLFPPAPTFSWGPYPECAGHWLRI